MLRRDIEDLEKERLNTQETAYHRDRELIQETK